MTTSNATTVDKTAEKTVTEKVHEKLAEKRRALGRGLESLLPGPRVVPAAPTLPQRARKDGAPDAAGSQFPVLSSQGPDSPSSLLSSPTSGADGGRAGTPLSPLSSSTSGVDGGRAGAPVSPPGAVSDELQAVASGQTSGGTADGEQVFRLAIDQIDQNPHQTRAEFDQQLLEDLANSIQVQGVLQPIVVRPGTEGRFVLILGERRGGGPEICGQMANPGGEDGGLGPQ